MAINPDDIRIAVVDDEKVILDVFSSLLTQAHYHADFFNNPQEAYQAIAAHPDRYDLVITDISMPQEDGVAFAKKVRSNFPRKIPFIFMTGYASEEKRKEALALGRVDFLNKPFILMEVVHKAIVSLLESS